MTLVGEPSWAVAATTTVGRKNFMTQSKLRNSTGIPVRMRRAHSRPFEMSNAPKVSEAWLVSFISRVVMVVLLFQISGPAPEAERLPTTRRARGGPFDIAPDFPRRAPARVG